jgi:hypothetical protein
MCGNELVDTGTTFICCLGLATMMELAFCPNLGKPVRGIISCGLSMISKAHRFELKV